MRTIENETIMADRELLSVIDNAWLRMDRPSNLMVICGMLTFTERVDLNRLKEVIRTRMLCFHRFRQRVVDREGYPCWEQDPAFDIDWHVRHLATSSSASLEDLLSDLVSSPLDPAKPMWQFHLVDTRHGGSAVILRIHHCYGDGFALMHVLDALTDTDPDNPRLPGGDEAFDADRRSAWERILGPVTGSLGDALRMAERVMETGLNLMMHPTQVIEYGMVGYALMHDTTVIATMTPDAPTRFKGHLGVMKRVAWAEPLSLFEVKAVGDAFGCSVNDVLLSCVAGALRSYLIAQDDEVDGLEMRALIPVNCRPPGRIRELGNRFGLVFLGLPIGVADPFERMMAVHRGMTALKRSQQPTVALGILSGMGLFPDAVKERVLQSLAANASAVITNVRGASRSQFLAGKRIEREVFWVPQSGGIGMGISILSYAGNVDFGVITDTRRVPDPAHLVRLFTEEFEQLLLCALLTPVPRAGTTQRRTVSAPREKAKKRTANKSVAAHARPNHGLP